MVRPQSPNHHYSLPPSNGVSHFDLAHTIHIRLQLEFMITYAPKSNFNLSTKDNQDMTRMIPLFLILFSLPAYAQLEVGGGLLDNCNQIDALVKDEKFPEAKEKTALCLEGIEQELSSEIGSYFHEEIGDWTRTSLDKNQAMGFSNISARYEKGSDTVNISLTGSTGGNSGLGGLLGGLAQSGMMGGGKQVTVAGIPSTISPEGDLMVPLEDGSILMFESSDFNSADAAIDGMGDLINDFPVADINEKLK